MEKRFLDISWGTIFKILVAIVFFYIIYLIRDLLVWFIFALIISILFNPFIEFLKKRKIPQVVAVLLVYIGSFGLLSFLIYLTAPVFVHEIQQFIKVLPQYFEKVSPPLQGLGFQAFESLETFLAAFGQTLEKMAGSIFNALFAIFGGIFSTSFVITIAIFLSMEEKAVDRTLSLLFAKKYEAYAINVWEASQKKVSGWFGARVLACLFVGVLSYIAFLLLGVSYPFSLALLAGALNFIPVVGPMVTGIFIFAITYFTSPLKAVFVLIVFTIIQQIENSILTPILTKKFVGLPPVLVLISLVVGAKLWGLLGAVLIIPLAGIVFEFFSDFLKKRKDRGTVVL